MTKAIHASSLATERIVPSTEVLADTGSRPLKAWYMAIAALCRDRTTFLDDEKSGMRRTQSDYFGYDLRRRDEKGCVEWK